MNCEGPATNALRIQPLTRWQLPSTKPKDSMSLDSLFEAADACLSGDSHAGCTAFPKIEWIHDDNDDESNEEGDDNHIHSTSSLPLPLPSSPPPPFPLLEEVTPTMKRGMIHRSFDGLEVEANRQIKKTLRRMAREKPNFCLASLAAFQQQEQLELQVDKQNHCEDHPPKPTDL